MKTLCAVFTRSIEQHNEVLNIWMQRKGEHSNIKSEYFQNSDIWMYRYFCINWESR